MTNPHVPHRFELELTVPGTPEQVWRAIASAEGISAWMLPTTLEPRLGGEVVFDMGPEAVSHGRVTGWEPPRRFAYEEDWATLYGHPGADVTPLATEFLVEARAGGTCVVRVVTSAFGTGADWEHEFWDDLDSGWAPTLDNLRLYLTHFPDRRATTSWLRTSSTATPEDALDAVRRALGATDVGDAVRFLDVDGRLERSLDRHALVRLEAPVPGLVSISAFGAPDATEVHLYGHLFGDDAPGYFERERPRWQAWLEGIAATSSTATATRSDG